MPSRALLLVVLIVISGLVASGPDSWASRRRQVTRERVEKVWLGLSEDELYMVRLDLKPAGDGTGAFSFRDEAPCLLRIVSWVYRDGIVLIDHDKPTCAFHLALRGEIQGDTLIVLMEGHRWKRKAELRREGEFVSRWERLKAVMPKEGAAQMNPR
jgi:hypothetical protein